MNIHLAFLVFFIYLVDCRDFYVGIFNKNDFLVAQDRLYKEKTPFRLSYAKYGRLFKCPITYFKVVDRLGVGRGPRVEVIRGGLRKKYVVLRLTSPYNLPISVNIYVGCENKMTTVTSTTSKKSVSTIGDSPTTTDAGKNGTSADENTDEGQNEATTVPVPATTDTATEA